MEDSAATAALVGVVLALIELVKRLTARGTGGADYRLAALEEKINDLTDSVNGLKKAFYEHREATLIRWAKQGDKDGER